MRNSFGPPNGPSVPVSTLGEARSDNRGDLRGSLVNWWLRHTSVGWERPYFGNNPGRRNLQKEAVVTVIILERLTVQASFAFRAGELNDRSVDEIVKAASALLPPMKR